MTTKYDLWLDKISYDRTNSYISGDIEDVMTASTRGELEDYIQEHGIDSTIGEIAALRSKAMKNRLAGKIDYAMHLELEAEELASVFESHDHEEYEDSDDNY